jgi:hypothetical protein
MCVEYVTNVMCCVLSLFYRQKLKSHGQERVKDLVFEVAIGSLFYSQSGSDCIEKK